MLKFYRILLLTLVAVFIASAAGIARYAADSCTQTRMYRQLAAQTEKIPDDAVSTGNDFLPQYQALYAQNSDLAGWIQIDGTNINYPVMQSKHDPDFYLKHNFEKADSPHGCPYVQANCDLQTPSDNILVYGHNMKDGTMFSDLLQYKRESFWEQHRIIRFDTMTAQAEYTVMAVFRGEAEDLRRFLTRWTDWGMAWNGNVPTPNLSQITENLYNDLPDAPTGSYLGSMGLPVATGETKIGISAWVSDLYDGVDAHMDADALNADENTVTIGKTPGTDYAIVPLLAQVEYPADGAVSEIILPDDVELLSYLSTDYEPIPADEQEQAEILHQTYSEQSAAATGLYVKASADFTAQLVYTDSDGSSQSKSIHVQISEDAAPTQIRRYQQELDDAKAEYAELQNARLNEAAEIRKLRTYYDDFKGWAEEFDTAPLEMKRMILSHLIDRVEVGRKYQVIVKFNMKYRQFLECTAETYNTEIGA